jgi:hypothetical protein
MEIESVFAKVSTDGQDGFDESNLVAIVLSGFLDEGGRLRV